MKHLLPLRDVDIRGRPKDRPRSLSINRTLLRIHLLHHPNLMLRKKLLRLSAARSTRAMIIPIHFAHASRIAEVIVYQ